MTTMSITLSQSKQIKRLAEDALDRAFAENVLDKDGFQCLIENGGEFQDGIMASLQRFAAPEPARAWTEENGVISFDVTSDGTTGPEWITRLEGKGLLVEDRAKSMLRSEDFKPTSGVTTKVKVIKVSNPDGVRFTRDACRKAARLGFVKPNAEVVCLIRELFTNQNLEQMGLTCIFVVHEPIKDSSGTLSLLQTRRSGRGGLLDAHCVKSGDLWTYGDSFAFASGS